MTMTRPAFGDHLSIDDVQRGKQRCRSVPFVIVSLPFRDAGAQRQYRLGWVESLNLALLIHAQYEGFFRRVHV